MPESKDQPLSDLDAELSRVGKLLSSTYLSDEYRGAEKPDAHARPSLRETNRNHHIFTLGAPFYGAGFRRGDADGLMGLLSLPSSAALALLARCSRQGNFSNALHTLLGKQSLRLANLGQLESWRKRWASYQAELESWQKVDREQRLNGAWRTKDMSEGQRHLVRVTATLLEILIPIEMTRGEAADWLSSNGANLAYQETE